MPIQFSQTARVSSLCLCISSLCVRMLSRGLTAVSILIVFFLASCRGDKSSKPPVMPIQNMVEQTSYGPQMPNTFFPDKRATREPLSNTVAQGEERIDTAYNKGQESGSTPTNPIWVTNFPLKLDQTIITQGQKNFNIYCSSCHGLSGHNDGLVTKRSAGSIRPADLHDPQIIARPNGKIYDAVTNGVNNWNMPGFSAQLNTTERWGVVAYVRALQISEQLPANSESLNNDMQNIKTKDVQSKKGMSK